MKHLFIINPTAGSSTDGNARIAEEIKTAMENAGADFEVYFTNRQGDAERRVRQAADSGEEIRIYACGGDGTFNEVVNGAVNAPNIAVAPCPCGTGNDFIKQFGEEKALFSDLSALTAGTVRPIDVIRCNDRYCANICAVGFDARVGSDVHRYSRLKGIAGYIVSLVVNFFKGINTEMTITAGDRTFSGEFALICACNGRFYGGGFNPLPDSRPDDGVMDTLVVNKCSRFQFLTMIGRYSTGRYAELAPMVTRLDDGHIVIECPTGLDINLDGEIMAAKRVELTVLSRSLNLICPRGMKFFDL